MKINVDAAVLGAMAEVLSPQLQTLSEKAMDAVVAEARKTTEDPLALLTIELAAGWVKEHGPKKAQELVGVMAEAMREGELADLHAHLSAEELTKLADAYQSAEARSQRRTRATLLRLGGILGNFGRYAGRAFIQAMVA